MILSVLIFLLSLFLYYIAPNTYSHTYCTILLIVYIIDSLWIIRNSVIKKNYFNFHLLFLISYFFVNFVYPVFIYPDNPFFFSVFKRSFNHDFITKSTALSLVGASAYILGVSFVRRFSNHKNDEIKTNFSTLHFLLLLLLSLFLILLIFFGGKGLIRGQFGATLNIPTGFLALFQVILGLTVILTFYYKDYKNTNDFIFRFNSPLLIFLLTFLFLFITTGDRGPAIQIVLLFIGAYSIKIKTFKLRYFLITVLTGMIFLTFISYARHPDITDKEKKGVTITKGLKNFKLNSFFDIGMDLIVCNRNLYVGYEYKKKDGLSYGKNMFPFIFAPVPFLPSTLTQVFFHTTPDDLSSAQIITIRSKSSYGLGTNLIADIYMAFGIVGVVFFMFVLGYLVRKYQIKAEINQNLNGVIVYLFLISFSIYLPRTSIWEPFRYIIWAILLIEFLKALRLTIIRLSHKKVEF